MKTTVYPITLDVNFYLINQEGAVAKVSIGFISGTLPTHDQIVDKLNEQVTLMQGQGEGLQGQFRICDYEEYCNAKLEEVNPIAAAGGPYAWLMPEDRVWYASEGCGCASCAAEEAKHDDPAALFAKLEGDSLDAIVEVMGEGNDFKQYNKGKSAMRDWFLGRLSRHLGIAWKRDEPVAEHKKAAPSHSYGDLDAGAANNTDPNKRGFDPK